MQDQPHEQSAEMVAACTVDAAHRRDHRHDVGQECHPHSVEVIHLGHRAVAVCHDCHADSGFLPDREAEALARRHLESTRGELSEPLVAVA